MKIDICHVYPITSGTAGTYMDSIYKALKNDFSEEIFVNYYYPYNYGKKVFYKYSDLCADYKFLKRHNFIRRIIRFFEMLKGLYKVYRYIKQNNVSILNYSLNSDLKIEYLFLKLVKLRETKIAITCHDVLPFGVSLENIRNSYQLKNKKRFFQLADYLIVHNENSIKELQCYFGIQGNRVILSPFPVMDIKAFDKEGYLPKIINNAISNQTFIVSMIGYFRKEKGLDILIKGWQMFTPTCPNALLIISGHFPNKLEAEKIRTIPQVIVHEGLLNDNAYTELIKKSDVIVMPYIRGTNSGIPSSILSMDTIVLTSDIDMFKTNPLISEQLMFKTNNSKDLASKLMALYKCTNNDIQEIKQKNKMKLETYIHTFKKDLISSYKKMIDKP